MSTDLASLMNLLGFNFSLELGVKMGSLADMEIKLDGIGHILSDNYLSVPIYQRSYAWEEKHIMDLFKDIATAINQNEKEYFLGSVVTIKTGTDHLEVVDGQQRLATTTILLAAIRDYFFQMNDINRVEDIERTFLTNRDIRSQEQLPRLKLNQSDHDFFLKKILMRSDKQERKVEPTKESHKRIAKAATLAAKHIQNITTTVNNPTETLIDWIEYIQSNAKVIRVLVPDQANAFTIFETLNDRGLALAISDLLKNYLFSISHDRVGEVQQRWVSMIGVLEAVESEEIVVTYIRHLWSSKYGLTREKELYEKIKNRITSKQYAVDFANELLVNAKLYAAMLTPDHDIWNRFGKPASEHMDTLNNLLAMSQMRPLILAILSIFNDDEVRKCLKLMVSWAVRFLILGVVGSGTLEHQYSQCAVEIRNGNIKTAKELMSAMQSVMPSDKQFLEAFSTSSVSKSSLARYYLRVLENQKNNNSAPELVPNNDQEVVNLEHILPQNPSLAWNHIDAETARTYYTRIGNLALLSKRINSDIGNEGFLQKLPYYRNSSFKLTSSLEEYSDWGADQIEKRQKELAELAVKAWANKI